ncbi:MAG: polysaccharide biosynthesis/export family protein [Opitutaceae bacterium]
MNLLRLLFCLAVSGSSLLLAAAEDSAQATPTSGDYRVQPGDLVRVQVFQEPDLDRELRVSQEGEVTLPLIGRVTAKERTLPELEAIIKELYDRDYLVNPQVNVMIVEYKERKINVLGAVNTPQSLSVPPEQSLTLLDAISRAGGFSRAADRKKVRLTRTGPDGKRQTHVINADELMTGNQGQAWVLLVNDIIFVPERIL